MVDFDDPEEWRRFQAECEEALEELDELVEQRKVYAEALVNHNVALLLVALVATAIVAKYFMLKCLDYA